MLIHYIVSADCPTRCVWHTALALGIVFCHLERSEGSLRGEHAEMLLILGFWSLLPAPYGPFDKGLTIAVTDVTIDLHEYVHSYCRYSGYSFERACEPAITGIGVRCHHSTS